MNYISHLNTIFKRFAADPKLNPTHISLYMALFQFWNISHFANVLFINREEVMKMSKIGSLATYHRCLKKLHQGKYIIYLPSHNPYKSSQIKFLKFDTTSGTTTERSSETTGDKSTERALVPNTNYIKPSKTFIDIPSSKKDVSDFFKRQNWPETEAKKFFNHYAATGWKIGGKTKIENWKAVAENWMLRKNEDGSRLQKSGKEVNDYLKISKSKDYGKPL